MEKVTKQYEIHAEMLKVLAHPVRLCMVRGLMEHGECNVSYMQQCLDSPQSTISQHIQKLKAAGIIEGRRDGLEIYYSVSSDLAKKVVNALLAE